MEDKLGKELAALKGKGKQLQEEKVNVLQLSKEIENIKASKSYKIGRFFTYIPRKIRKKDKK